MHEVTGQYARPESGRRRRRSKSRGGKDGGEIEEQLHKLEQMVKLLIHSKFTPEQAHYFCLHALPRSTSAALRLRLPHGLAQRLAGYLHFVLEAAAALGAKERVKVGRRGFFTKAAPIRIDHRASNTLDLRGADEGGMDPARAVG